MMRKLLLAAVLVLMASGAQAVTLNVVGGQLMGASGVLVDGSLYDVQFIDGTCIDLFNGCDEASDFTFQTQASAVLASQALLDQVFLDGVEGQFDSFPHLTNGCPGAYVGDFASRCDSQTPYPPDFSISPPTVVMAYAANSPPHYGSDYVFAQWYENPEWNSFVGNQQVYAVWSASVVPEPSTALLLSLGLTGLAAKGRRRS